MSTEFARKKIEDLKSEFTPEEIDNSINFLSTTSEVPVLYQIIATLREYNNTDDMQNKIRKLMVRPNNALVIDYDFNGESYKFSMSLGPCNKDYNPIDFWLPEVALKEAHEYINMLKTAAIAYWEQFISVYPEIYKELIDLKPNVFDTIKTERDSMTLYFDKFSSIRTGIRLEYLDKNSNRITKLQ